MKSRLVGACGAALAVIAGLALAPYSHVHPAGATPEHHPAAGDPGAAPVKHAHFAPHDRHHPEAPRHDEDAGDDHPDDEPIRQITSSNDFVFQAAGTFRDPAPAAVVQTVDVVPDVAAGTVVEIRLPPAHGPPGRSAGPARAPPTVPPAAL